MALSMDDRILGEKTHYYCSSSSEDEDEDPEMTDPDERKSKSSGSKGPTFVPEHEITNYNGHCTNVRIYPTQKN